MNMVIIGDSPMEIFFNGDIIIMVTILLFQSHLKINVLM